MRRWGYNMQICISKTEIMIVYEETCLQRQLQQENPGQYANHGVVTRYENCSKTIWRPRRQHAARRSCNFLNLLA